MIPFSNPGMALDGTFMGTLWNAFDKSTRVTLSDSGRTAAANNVTETVRFMVRAIAGKSAGKFHMEIHVISSPGGDSESAIGLALSSAALDNGLPGGVDGTIGMQQDGQISLTVGTTSTVLLAANPNLAWDGSDSDKWLIFEIDLTAQKLWVKLYSISAGTSSLWNSNGTANPATGAGGVDISGLSGTVYPALGMENIPDQFTANFGQLPFIIPASTGYGAWF